jgi:malate permease and related proteins
VWQLATGLVWTGLGLFFYYLLPDSWPKKLGRSLYWVVVPLQVLGLAHNSDFAKAPWLPPLAAIAVLIVGLVASILCLQGLKPESNSSSEWTSLSLEDIEAKASETFINNSSINLPELFKNAWPKQPSSRGSFILAAMLGNTIYIGLAVIPFLVSVNYMGWIVIYGITHSLLGSYGMGVFLASYFGRTQHQHNWLSQLIDVLTVPSLWAFVLGLISQSINYPNLMDLVLQIARWTVVPAVFILLGMQLGKFRGVQGLQTALIPALIKMLVLPIIAGVGLTIFGLHGDARLTLVLMAGMPTSSSNLILAEEYNLDSQLAAGSILLSTIALPLLLPLWVFVFQ